MAMKDPELLNTADFPIDFGRYRLVGLLGEGGMGRVFRAELQGGGQFKKALALKVVRSSALRQNPGLSSSLEMEARLGALLDHPHIVSTFEFDTHEGIPYIVMELMRGLNLAEYLASGGRLCARQIVEVGKQIADALHYAHAFEDGDEQVTLVHRDLKPSNIFLTRNGIVKILDFGIAKASEGFGDNTATGIAKGTIGYMSPEQFETCALDGRSDIFSLGTILYELAVGQPLFTGSSQAQILKALIQVESLLVREKVIQNVDAHVPGLGAMVHRCLREEPTERYQTAGELAQGLASLAHTLPLPSPLQAAVRALMSTEGGEGLTKEPAPMAPPPQGNADSLGSSPVNGGRTPMPNPTRVVNLSNPDESASKTRMVHLKEVEAQERAHQTMTGDGPKMPVSDEPTAKDTAQPARRVAPTSVRPIDKALSPKTANEHTTSIFNIGNVLMALGTFFCSLGISRLAEIQLKGSMILPGIVLGSVALLAARHLRTKSKLSRMFVMVGCVFLTVTMARIAELQLVSWIANISIALGATLLLLAFAPKKQIHIL